VIMGVVIVEGKRERARVATSRVGTIVIMGVVIVEGKRELPVQCEILCIGCWITHRLVRGTGTKT
jgi:hypothetical protein